MINTVNRENAISTDMLDGPLVQPPTLKEECPLLTLCICDDEPKDIAHIQTLAECFAGEHPEFPLRIQTFSSSFDLLEHLEGTGGFDLYLLDIIMPHLKGVELAKHIRARDEAAEIIFLTYSPEYALDAFEVAACGYLLKPVSREKFDKVLLPAARRLALPKDPYFLLKTKEGLRKILFRDLVVVESFNHSRVCTLTDGSRLITADTLASIMDRLSSDPRFFSPHRAYIINLGHISALNASYVLLPTGQHIPVARNSYAALKQAYVDYLF